MSYSQYLQTLGEWGRSLRRSSSRGWASFLGRHSSGLTHAELQQWMFPQRFIRDLKLGEGGEEGRDIEPALDRAREAAGDRDVRIAGGGATVLRYVNAGLIDEFSIALSPVLFGS